MLVKGHRDADRRRAADGGIDGQKRTEIEEVKRNEGEISVRKQTTHFSDPRTVERFTDLLLVGLLHFRVIPHVIDNKVLNLG